jgi:hypothetical protein
MQAIKELADRLDGRPAPIGDDASDPDRPRLTKIVHEFVHLEPRPQLLIEEKDVTQVNGNGHD